MPKPQCLCCPGQWPPLPASPVLPRIFHDSFSSGCHLCVAVFTEHMRMHQESRDLVHLRDFTAPPACFGLQEPGPLLCWGDASSEARCLGQVSRSPL